MSFSELSWKARFKKGGMGDLAEGVFEQVYGLGKWDRFGLDRARISLVGVPAEIRHAPDYITNKGLVEVQGFGRDQKIKLKHAKWDALLWWQRLWRTDLFLWDSHNQRYGWVRLPELTLALNAHGTDDAFDGGRNPYTWIEADDVPVVDGIWVDYIPEPLPKEASQ